MKNLEKLVEVRSASGDEENIKNYILKHIESEQSSWKVQPKIVHGQGFQDAIIFCHDLKYRHCGKLQKNLFY